MNKKTMGSIIATGILSFAGIVVETAMNVAFPTLMSEFHVSVALVQWLTTGYLLVLSLIIPTSSFLKRSFPTKNLFIISNVFFISGTLLAMLACNFWMILIGRLIQGVGTGIALPLMFNIIVERVHPSKIGTVMGFANLIIAFAPAIGPTMGGYIVKTFGWRDIFLVLLPLLVISFLIGIKSIEQISKIEHLKFNWINWIALAIAFSCIIFATNDASDYGWLSIHVLALICISIISIVFFYFHSKKDLQPLIRVNVFSNLRFDLSTIALMISQFSILGVSLLIPNFAQLVLHKNAFVAGFLLLPGTTLGIVMSLLGGKALDYYGAKKPILFGFGAYAIAMLLLTVFLPNINTGLIIIFFAIAVIGQAFSSGNTLTNGLQQLPNDLNTDGNAVLNTVQQLAGALGTSIVATIVANAQNAKNVSMQMGTLNGARSAFGLLFILQIIAIILNIIIFRNKNNKA